MSPFIVMTRRAARGLGARCRQRHHGVKFVAAAVASNSEPSMQIPGRSIRTGESTATPDAAAIPPVKEFCAVAGTWHRSAHGSIEGCKIVAVKAKGDVMRDGGPGAFGERRGVEHEQE